MQKWSYKMLVSNARLVVFIAHQVKIWSSQQGNKTSALNFRSRDRKSTWQQPLDTTPSDTQRKLALMQFSSLLCDACEALPKTAPRLFMPTAVTRWWPPVSASQRTEPVWVAIGIWQGASRALWGLFVCAFDCFIDSVGTFGSTA